MSNYLQDLANLIQVRQFLVNSQDDLRIKLTREQGTDINRKITEISQLIVNKSLALNLQDTTLPVKAVIQHSFESSRDPEEILNELRQKKEPLENKEAFVKDLIANRPSIKTGKKVKKTNEDNTADQ